MPVDYQSSPVVKEDSHMSMEQISNHKERTEILLENVPHTEESVCAHPVPHLRQAKEKTILKNNMSFSAARGLAIETRRFVVSTEVSSFLKTYGAGA